MCAKERANVASCPLYDFSAWESLRSKPGLHFVAGGSARFGSHHSRVSECFGSSFSNHDQEN